MIKELLIMNGYGVYVLSAFGFTLLSFVAMNFTQDFIVLPWIITQDLCKTWHGHWPEFCSNSIYRVFRGW